MAIYNNPVITAIKNLISSSKDGEFDFDPEIVNGVLQRFLDRNVKFRGSISVRDDKNRLIFRYKKGKKVSFADPMSLSAKIISEIPKDGKWYKHPFHKRRVRYTPDSVEFSDEVYDIIQETFTDISANNKATYDEINSYVLSTGNDPIFDQDTFNYINDLVQNTFNLINKYIEDFEEQYTTTPPTKDDLQSLQSFIYKQYNSTSEEVLNTLYSGVNSSGLTNDEKNTVTSMIDDTYDQNTHELEYMVDYIYDSYENEINTGSMDAVSGSTEEEVAYYELGYESGISVAMLDFAVAPSKSGVYYEDKSSSAISVPEEYEDDFVAGFEDGYNSQNESTSGSSDGKYKIHNVQELFKSVSKDTIIDIVQIDYERGCQLAKYIDINQKKPIIYVSTRESALSFVKGIYDVFNGNKIIKPIQW